MASKRVNGRQVLVGSKADPDSSRYDPYNPNSLRRNSDRLNQQLADRNPKRFDKAADSAGFGYISGDDLQKNRDFDLPEVPPTTDTAGALGAIQAYTDTFTKNLEANRESARKREEDSWKAYFDSALGSEDEVSRTAREYSREGGVDDLEAELDDINQQILAEQRALDTSLRDLEDRGGGLTSGMDVERNRLRGESLRRQADLAIIQLSRQGKYDSAKKIADRAVAAQLEEQRIKNDTLKLSYERNKGMFDKEEQRLFETQQNEREHKLENEEYRLRAEYDQKIRQNDPKYQLELEKLRQDVAAGGDNPYGTLNGKPQNATQALVQGYADRTNEADVTISNLGNRFTGFGSLFAQAVPQAFNILKSTERQQYEQAQRNFVNAVLRRESGAVISDQEFANARLQYFPQPGDKPEVVAQKAANRATVINSLYKQANVPRLAIPGQVIQDSETGERYQVDLDGETLIPLDQ